MTCPQLRNLESDMDMLFFTDINLKCESEGQSNKNEKHSELKICFFSAKKVSAIKNFSQWLQQLKAFRMPLLHLQKNFNKITENKIGSQNAKINKKITKTNIFKGFNTIICLKETSCSLDRTH